MTERAGGGGGARGGRAVLSGAAGRAAGSRGFEPPARQTPQARHRAEGGERVQPRQRPRQARRGRGVGEPAVVVGIYVIGAVRTAAAAAAAAAVTAAAAVAVGVGRAVVEGVLDHVAELVRRADEDQVEEEVGPPRGQLLRRVAPVAPVCGRNPEHPYLRYGLGRASTLHSGRALGPQLARTRAEPGEPHQVGRRGAVLS